MSTFSIIRRVFRLLPHRVQRRLRRLFINPPTEITFDWEKALQDARDQRQPNNGVTNQGSRNPLEEFFDQRQAGRGIWKWRHYFPIYHRHLERFVGQSPKMLEIGVYSGGSLDMWKHYYGDGCQLIGVDIEEACVSYADERTKILIGDQSDRMFWRSIREELLGLDIVLDDGGHQPHQQIPTLEEVFPLIKPGGIYICEDLPGVDNRFADYVREFCAQLNHTQYPQQSKELRYLPSAFQRSVASVHFYPFIIVIEKQPYPEAVEFVAPKHGTEWQPFL